jgi:hypothetical protein
MRPWSSHPVPVSRRAFLVAGGMSYFGIDHRAVYEDEFQHLRNRLSDGEPVRDLG